MNITMLKSADAGQAHLRTSLLDFDRQRRAQQVMEMEAVRTSAPKETPPPEPEPPRSNKLFDVMA